MTLLQAYEAAILAGKIIDDPRQRSLLPVFQELTDALQNKTYPWLKWRRKAIQGIYLYGSVGAGKTWLMDLFYQHLVLHGRGKMRLHFHHFMQQIDGQLRRLQGKKNPLQSIVRQLAKTTSILCLDEMLVHDVAHAMILAELFKYLFEANIVLVTTSNTAPDDLYRHGVQRNRFLPAIEAIKHHCTIIDLSADRDFRLHQKTASQTWLYPLNTHSEAMLDHQFQALGETRQVAETIHIQNRDIPFIKRCDKAIWFDFNVICHLPRSQLDYLELSQTFSTILISNVSKFESIDSAKAILFILLIDVLYDKKIRLILSAACPLEDLFGDLRECFQRTYSRLQEMQSLRYS